MTKRNIELLSNKDMFVKYADVVEVVRNAKITILHSGGQNMVQYHGLKEDKNIFRIFSATPNVNLQVLYTNLLMCCLNHHLRQPRNSLKTTGILMMSNTSFSLTCLTC